MGGVEHSSKGHAVPEMNTVGIGLALAVVFLLVSLLPFIVVVAAKLVALARGRAA